MHVTPENQTLQLKFEGLPAPGSAIETFALSPGSLWSATWLTPAGWQVLAALPLAALALESSGWLSVGRYDYQPGRAKPVLSSTSRCAEPNFHRRWQWTPFTILS